MLAALLAIGCGPRGPVVDGMEEADPSPSTQRSTAVSLRLQEPPGSVRVGEAVVLRVVASDDRALDNSHLTWVSAHPDVLAVEHGRVLGKAVGTTWITVSEPSGTSAMVEIAVVPR